MAEIGTASADTKFRLATQHLQRRDLAAAEAAAIDALRIQPNHLDALLLLSNILHETGRRDEAVNGYSRVLELRPTAVEVVMRRAAVLQECGQLLEAIAGYDDVLRLRPRAVGALSNKAIALLHLGQPEAALKTIDTALALNPKDSNALNNRCEILISQGRTQEALETIDKALSISPTLPDALINRGILLRHLGRTAEALWALQRAVQLAPYNDSAHRKFGSALSAAGFFAEAVQAYGRAVELAPDSTEARAGLGLAFVDIQRWEEALTHLDVALAQNPKQISLRGTRNFVLAHIFRLTDKEATDFETQLLSQTNEYPPPFQLLPIYDIPPLHRRAAESEVAPPLPAITSSSDRSPNSGRKLRLGYFSNDFHEHATAYLIAEVFELHNRSLFDVVALSYGKDDGGAMRRRISSATEFHDLHGLQHVAKAQRIKDAKIDILVDLKGWTAGTESNVLSAKPSPIQVNWLGYPGTSGMEFIDYIIADKFIVPVGSEQWYSEHIVRLPDCYQPNDRQRRIGQVRSKVEYGLPPSSLVLCSFNQFMKLRPEVFNIWMDILRQVPDAVLWLLTGPAMGENAIRAQALAAGVDPSRIVFAPKVAQTDHLARYAVCDLALDTYPYNSHTTASDALFGGCPLVTMVGQSFHTRVAGSILSAAGLSHLITNSLEEYRDLVLYLAQNNQKLIAVREEWAEKRKQCALFDTPRFVSNLETAFLKMWEAHTLGKAPDNIDVF